MYGAEQRRHLHGGEIGEAGEQAADEEGHHKHRAGGDEDDLEEQKPQRTIRSGFPANTLMTNWGWFTTITAIIIPKMAGGLVCLLYTSGGRLPILKKK